MKNDDCFNITMKNVFQLVVITLTMVSYNSQKKIADYYFYETECLGIKIDGSKTLNILGNVRNG